MEWSVKKCGDGICWMMFALLFAISFSIVDVLSYICSSF